MAQGRRQIALKIRTKLARIEQLKQEIQELREESLYLNDRISTFTTDETYKDGEKYTTGTLSWTEEGQEKHLRILVNGELSSRAKKYTSRLCATQPHFSITQI